jgi:short-subunit dehydrogenase
MESKNEFLQKNIIVTGASSGIGMSVALFFLN